MSYGFKKGGGSSGGTSIAFNGNRAVTRPGLPQINAGGKNLKEWAENYFFPSVPPSAALSGGGTREFGDSTAITLNWTAFRNTNPINLIDVAGQMVAPTGNTQSGSRPVNGAPNTSTTWWLTVRSTTGELAQAATTLSFASRRRVGRIAKTGQDETIGGVHQVLTDADIIANTNILSDLSATRGMTLNGLQGQGQYLFFLWPVRYGLPPLANGKPSLKINNLDNNAFSIVRNNVPFTNPFGYTENCYLIMSDTIYAGTVNLIVP